MKQDGCFLHTANKFENNRVKFPVKDIMLLIINLCANYSVGNISLCVECYVTQNSVYEIH